MSLVVQLGAVVAAARGDLASSPVMDIRTSIGESEEPDPMEASASSEADTDDGRGKYPVVPYQFVLQDHNYGAPPPPTPPQSPPRNQVPCAPPCPSPVPPLDEDSQASAISSNRGEAEPEGEETETAPEGEGDEDAVTRCICDFEHDDGYMICCDKCSVWQHVDCMGIDRSNIPDEYWCERCRPRRVDRQRARTLQLRKREELNTDSSSSGDGPEDTAKKKPNNVVYHNSTRKTTTMKRVRRQRRDSSRNSQSSSAGASEKKASSATGTRKRRDSSKSEPKRVPVKRKSRSSRGSGPDVDEETQDSWDHANGRLRQWIDRYEEAVTNHYSPELRSRVSSIRLNGSHSDFKPPHVAHPRCRMALAELGTKILMSTSALQPNQVVIEIRGKFMMASQYRQQNPVVCKRYQPYVFYHQLPKEGPEICVDTRTYGNDARFVRRSCKPNAQIKHCIEKGSLHMYIVTVMAIEKNKEILVSHDLMDVRVPGPCMCDLKDCALQKSTTPTTTTTTTPPPPPEPEREKRRRSRRTVSSDDFDPVLSSSHLSSLSSRKAPKSPVKSPVIAPTPPPPPPPPPPPVIVAEESVEAIKVELDCDQAEKRKLSREERKIEAIVKAIERMEKAEQRRQEVLARQQQKKGHDEDDRIEPLPVEEVPPKPSLDRIKRKGKKGRGRTTTPQRRHSRVNSGDSDATSPDEGSLATGGESGLSSVNFSHTLSPLRGERCSPPMATSPGFKFPKTKKALMNEWLNESVEPLVSPGGIKQDGSPTDQSETIPTCYVRGSRSPTTGISASHLRRTCSTGSNQCPSNSVSGSAKKRWLRQAISEETDVPMGNGGVAHSPNSRTGSPPPSTDYVTPLKKRRLARESVSSEQSFTPPATPVPDMDCDSQSALPAPILPLNGLRAALFENSSMEVDSTPSVKPKVCLPVIKSKLDLAVKQTEDMIPADTKEECAEVFSKETILPVKKIDFLDTEIESESLDKSVKEGEGKPKSDTNSVEAEKEGNKCTFVNDLDVKEEDVKVLEQDKPVLEVKENNTLETITNDSDKKDEMKRNVTEEKEQKLEQDATTVKEEVEHNSTRNESEKAVEKNEITKIIEVQMEESGNSTKVTNEELTESAEVEKEKCGNKVSLQKEEPEVKEEKTGDNGSVEKGEIKDSAETKNKDILPPATLPENADPRDARSSVPVISGGMSLDMEASKNRSTEAEVTEEVTKDCAPSSEARADERDGAALLEADTTEPATNKRSEGEQEMEDEDRKSEEQQDALLESTANEMCNSDQKDFREPAKRKLSILEYRQRKMEVQKSDDRVSGESKEDDQSEKTKSFSAEEKNVTLPQLPFLSTLPLFDSISETDEKKKGLQEVRWNSAPTLVERQRENLTQRLRREFGLFLSDDEDQDRSRRTSLSEAPKEKNHKSGRESGEKEKKSHKAPPPPPPPPPDTPPPSHIQTLMGVHAAPAVYIAGTVQKKCGIHKQPPPPPPPLPRQPNGPFSYPVAYPYSATTTVSVPYPRLTTLTGGAGQFPHTQISQYVTAAFRTPPPAVPLNSATQVATIAVNSGSHVSAKPVLSHYATTPVLHQSVPNSSRVPVKQFYVQQNYFGQQPRT